VAIAEETRRKRRVSQTARPPVRQSDPAFLPELARDLFARTSGEDLGVYSAEEIDAFVRSAAADLALRQPGRHKIRVGAIDLDGVEGRHKQVTLVEIVNDNMPFLVDSVMA
jgi:glutamate dehydrogenase